MAEAISLYAPSHNNETHLHGQHLSPVGENEIKLHGEAAPSFVGRILRHRWTRVIAFGAAVTLTSCLYAGWQQFSLLLMHGGKYDWLCAADEMVMTEGGVIACSEQERAIGTLFPLAAAMELLGAVFAGVALDHCGPRSTAIVGEILGVVSIVLMMCSTADRDLLPASMITTGVAINLVAFPSLILEDYFPSAAATTAAFVVACQSLACLVAPLMWLSWQRFTHWTFNGIWTAYLIAVWVPTALFYCLCLPKHRECSKKTDAQPNTLQIAPNISPAELLPTPGQESTEASACTVGVVNAFMPAYIVEDETVGGQHDGELILPLDDIIDPNAHHGWRAFGKACISTKFLVFNIVNMILMLQTAYYQVIVRSESGAAVSDFVGWAMPTQAIWGLMLGRTVDFVKTPAMLLALLMGYGVTYLLILAGRSRVQFATAGLFIVVCSYAYTVKYSYIQETFHPSFYGKLIGISGALSGVSVLLTNVLTGTQTVHFWCLVLAGCSLLSMPLTMYLWWSTAPRKMNVDPDHKDYLSAHLVQFWSPVPSSALDGTLTTPLLQQFSETDRSHLLQSPRLIHHHVRKPTIILHA